MDTQTSTHTAERLRALAKDVFACPAGTRGMTAREAARALMGAVRMVSVYHGPQAMQDACAALACNDEAWATDLEKAAYSPGTAVWPILNMARGIIVGAGRVSTRAAVSFWAVERDPAVWRNIAGL